jgi:hypothetical protein
MLLQVDMQNKNYHQQKQSKFLMGRLTNRDRNHAGQRWARHKNRWTKILNEIWWLGQNRGQDIEKLTLSQFFLILVKILGSPFLSLFRPYVHPYLLIKKMWIMTLWFNQKKSKIWCFCWFRYGIPMFSTFLSFSFALWFGVNCFEDTDRCPRIFSKE